MIFLKGFRSWPLLLREFFSPAREGAFWDEALSFYPNLEKRPARVYVAISHRHLYFHLLKLPVSVQQDKLVSAARLEAQRLLSSFRRDSRIEISLGLLRVSQQEVLLVFCETELVRKVEAALPRGLVLCGIFPAWVALLAWFRLRRKEFTDGLYFLSRPDGYEGFLQENGRIARVLPFSPQAAEGFLKAYSGPRFEASTEDPEALLAEGAYLVPELPLQEITTLEGYPLRRRPRIPKKAQILWLIPPLILGAGEGLRWYYEKVFHQAAAIHQEVSTLKKRYQELEQEQKRRQALKELETLVDTWIKERPRLTEALLELTRLLPKGSWVRKFEFRYPKEIRLWGETDNALELMKQLESSEVFTNVKFITSVTKNMRTGKEIFSIRMELESPFAQQLNKKNVQSP